MGSSEAKDAVGLFKDILLTVKAMQNVDPRLMDQLKEFYGKLIELQKNESNLMERVNSLEEQGKLKDMIFSQEQGVFYMPYDVEKKQPFCHPCKVRFHRLSPLKINKGGHLFCYACGWQSS